MPSRRRALFAARDMMALAAATPALAAAAPAPQTLPALRVVHGFVDQRSILLWMQGVRAHPVHVEVREGTPTGPIVQTADAELDTRADCTATVPVADLDQGMQHHYIVRRTDASKAILARGAFKTQPLWQWRGDAPTVRIAAGSCNYLNDPKFDRPGKPYGGGEEIFDTIAATAPDLMLWLGDNLYLREVDWTSREGVNRRYRFYRAHASMRKLWTACPHVAIWDDHDFGPDDSDASFSGRGWSLEMFQRYWPMPFSAPGDGLYGHVLQGDVDIFMLDDRSNRFPNRWPEGPDKVMYGAKQMQWLKAALTYSRAPFKLVAGGSQFFNTVSGDTRESWARFPAEQGEFRRWLDASRIPGVIFLSGDRHFASQMRIERPGMYAINEVTTSPLTSGIESKVVDAERNSTDIVSGTMLFERNFAMITVSGPRARRELLLEIRDTKGDKKWEWRTTAAELATGTRA